MADLYGELLARTLNRGAPPGHSAAYITPQEGGILRAFGGGVPPGGGQYMANGIPSFQGESGDYDPSTGDYGPPDATGSTGSGAGSGASGGGDDDSFSAPSGVLGGLDVTGVGAVSAAHDSSSRQAPTGHSGWSFDDAYGMGLQAAAQYAQRQARGIVSAVPQTRGITNLRRAPPEAPIAETPQQAREAKAEREREREEREYQEKVADMVAALTRAAPPADITAPPPETLHEIAARNLEDINLNPDYVEHRGPPAGYRGQPAAPPTYTEAGREALARDISRGGIGSIAPGTTLANNNPTATTEDVAHVNQHSERTGGYSVNDPYDNVSVPAGMNMGVIPALAGTIASFGHPLMGMALLASGYPTAGRMALNAARADTGMIGTAARGFQTNVTDPINRALGVVTQPIEQLGGFLGGRVRAGASAVGGFLDENVVDPLGQFATGLGEDITGALPDLPDFSIGDVLSQGEAPVGTFQDPQAGGTQEVFVPPQPAPVTEPFVPDDAERQFAEIPPEILARILANEKFGRERVGLA
jgi:hypothetical protein